MLRDRRASPEEVSRRNELAERALQFTILISPTLRRRTFQLRLVYGLSIRDTAKLLGIPNGTVKAQTARARAKLKLLMQNSVGGKESESRILSKRRQGVHVVGCCSNQTRAVSVPRIRSLVPQETMNGAGKVSARN